MVLLYLPLPLVIWLSSIYSPYYRIYMSFLYKPKQPKPFPPFFYYRLLSQLSLPSNVVISNPILSSLATDLTQHPHLHYTYSILVLVLHAQHSVPYNIAGLIVLPVTAHYKQLKEHNVFKKSYLEILNNVLRLEPLCNFRLARSWLFHQLVKKFKSLPVQWLALVKF